MGKKQRTRKQTQKGGAHEPLPQEVVDWMLTNNIAAFQQALQSKTLDPNKEYTYSKDVMGLGKKRSYDGTLLGFLFGLQFYLYGVPLPKAFLESLYFLFLQEGAKNQGSYFLAKKDYYHSTLALAIVLDQTQYRCQRILESILADLSQTIPWTSELTKIVMNDILQILRETLNDDPETIRRIKAKWIPYFDELTHHTSMKSVLRNVKQVANTRRKKRNLMSELKFLPAISEFGFPGGNEYRKAAERWETQVTSV